MSNLSLLLPGAAAVCALGVIAVWRPAVACALLAAAIPVTAGLGRGTVIPLLRVNEALLLVVVGGWVLHNLPRRRTLAFNGLDLAVFTFCVGGALIPWALLFLTRQAADLSDWMIIVGPVQYLIVFLLISRTEFSSSELRLFLNLVMVASIPVALIALAELLNLGGVRQLFATFYPTQPLPSWDTVYRPTSLLGHYSAVGAFGLLNFLLALALAATRHPDYPPWWLAVVLGANLVGTVAANTYAPLVALPLGIGVVLVFARHIPWRQFALAPIATGACLWLLWPHIQQRLQVQLTAFHAGGLPLPESLQTRIDYWQGFFVPALLKHGVWLGTGTLMPSEVPRPLVGFVDNGYLWQLFRAGVPGLATLIILLGAVAAAGWVARSSGDPTRRALGATCLAAVACILVLDTTSEYLTMTAVTQEFWMLVGLLSGLALAAVQAQRRPVLVVRPETATIIPAWWTDAAVSVRRLAPERLLLRSSVAVVIGLGLAKTLGFLFQVVTGRLLFPSEFGRLAYALAAANVLSVLLTAAPLGLSRFLARHEGEPREQNAYYTTYLTIVFAVLVFSAAVTIAVAGPIGLGGWMLLALLANLFGITALETYREVLRGLGRYTLQSIFYVLANVLQLLVVVVAATFALHSPTLFVTIYGLSGLAALVVIAPASPLGLRLSWSALSWRRVRLVVRFARPLLVQAVFWNVWFSGDLILVRHLMTASDTGSYGAAKAIANGFALIPTALGFVFAPRVARLAESEVRGHLLRVLGFATALTAPLTALVVTFAHPLTAGIFGGKYAAAAVPLVVLSLGMAVYGIKSVLSSLWLGVGYPVVMTISSGVAMAVTLAAGLVLIPRFGLVGAATAFSSGALAQLLVEGAVTAWAFGSRTPRVRHFSGSTARRVRGIAAAQAAPAAANILLVAEELDLIQDEGYTKFTRVLEAELGRRRNVVTYVTRGHRWDGNAVVRLIHRTLEVTRCALSPQLRDSAPDVVLYASRSSLTLPALLRAWLLKMLCRAPVALVALQGSGAGVLRRRLARHLVPDLLLVPTERELLLARGHGVNAACVWSGVDMERFRPAKPGEREALRQRYGLPTHRRIILHVGHLRQGRNVTALLPLAGEEGVTLVLVASGRRSVESEALKSELEQGGAVVLDGYQPRVEELYRLADCYVFPTVAPDHAVAMPLSVLEALASGVPVVSTRFGALEDLLGSAPGLQLVDDAAELIRCALDISHEADDAHALAKTFSWYAISDRLLGLLDELVWARKDESFDSAGMVAVGAARARRLYVGRSGAVRRVRHRRRPGYAARPAASVAVKLVAASRPLPEPPQPPKDVIGVVDATPAERSALRAAAGFYGLSVKGMADRSPGSVAERALLEDWPLVSGQLQTILDLPVDRTSELLAYVRRGGTLYLDGLEPTSNAGLVELGRRLGLELPTVVMRPKARRLLLPADVPGFAHELAGTRLETDCGRIGFQMVGGARALAFGVHTRDLYPIVVDLPAGSGRLVLSVLAPTLRCRLADAFSDSSVEAAAALVPMLLLRELYGCAVWHAPAHLANFTIDDPALRHGVLGMPYEILLGQARDHGFHVTVATVPRELPLAEASVIWRLRTYPEVLSACYHGCDHDGYEFYLPNAARTRYPSRPLEAQRAALARAIEHGRRFQAQTGCSLDRVMVFPVGVGPVELFRDLHRRGFIATSNYGDKYPLGAPIPDDADLGLRPADLAWQGFPLLWRRGFTDQGFLLDLFLQRPALTFAHLPWLQRRGFEPLLERAEAINRAGRGQVLWRSLDEVARHAYLQRRLPGGSWEVLLTSNEACLHNPDPVTRSYALRRPHRPAGSHVEVDGARLAPHLEVTVPPHGTAVVRLVAEDAVAGLGGREGCSIFVSPPVERRELA
jgi:O-antigen/teichoic acid export membrane protein/glycosyltransferase involved in cell wall biosynthesis